MSQPAHRDLTAEAALAAVRARREALYQAIIGLEDALATAVGDGERWRLRVAMAVDHARARIDDHVTQTECKNGFLDRVVIEHPRLARRVAQLRVDHERLEKSVDALAVATADIEDDEVAEGAPALRNQAVELLGEMTRHRQRGADLIYEAFQVDIGQSA